MTVWLLVFEAIDDFEIMGVYATEQAAETAAAVSDWNLDIRSYEVQT